MERILSALYKVVCKEATLPKLKSTSRRAYEFEDIVCKVVTKFSRNMNIKVSPPRRILNLPTLSGVKHQVDCFFTYDRTTCVIECKRRQFTTIEQVSYFNSILIDYILGLKVQRADHLVNGIFVSTAPLDDGSLKYCIVYAITVIHPDFPPIIHMLNTTKDEDLKRALKILNEKLPTVHPLYRENELNELDRSSLSLLNEYTHLISHWKSKYVM